MTSEPDIKDEIDTLFRRRSDDRHTQWPMTKDTDYGHPHDVCVCGHDRERHGFKGHTGALRPGHGNCTDMKHLEEAAPGDPNRSLLRSCTCSQFVLKEKANE